MSLVPTRHTTHDTHHATHTRERQECTAMERRGRGTGSAAAVAPSRFCAPNAWPTRQSRCRPLPLFVAATHTHQATSAHNTRTHARTHTHKHTHHTQCGAEPYREGDGGDDERTQLVPHALVGALGDGDRLDPRERPAREQHITQPTACRDSIIRPRALRCVALRCVGGPVGYQQERGSSRGGRVLWRVATDKCPAPAMK